MIFVFSEVEFPDINKIPVYSLRLVYKCECQYKTTFLRLFALMVFMEDLFSTFGADTIEMDPLPRVVTRGYSHLAPVGAVVLQRAEIRLNSKSPEKPYP
ncbi:MAG: hypothetical protein BWX96_00668 [Bacteroidetes bacterium ADurb.Bin145]|nr:MAG: hypothetical protein BWX96_00668 [Bacteroidetes bacterium ADurb.Bin145]